jgi:hypothetical protein
MKNITKISLLFLLTLFFACDDVSNTTGSNGSNNGMETPNDSTTANPNTYSDDGTKIDTPDLKDCPISGKAHDKNIFRMDDMKQMIAISADKSTYDADLGDSHRILEVFNTTDCSNLLKVTLPVNRSADFPYYLAPNCYEKSNKIVGIQGYTNLYYYDVENQRLSKPLEPSFLTEKEMVDAQSGMIRGLMVWGHYLLGHSIDNGPFAFDISDKANPKVALPIAEYLIPNTTEYRYLFVLDAGNGRFQAFIPVTDIDAGGNLFEVQNLFPQALKVETTVPKSARNNRYIVLKDFTDPSQEKRVAIDMYTQRNVPLPGDIATKKIAEILAWLKAQQ